MSERTDRPPARAAGPTHAESARTLVAAATTGSLATVCVDPPGYPFASVTQYALDDEGGPVLALSKLAEHTRNLANDDRASLLVVPTGADRPLASPRVTLIGRCAPIEETAARDAAREAYLRADPDAGFVNFPDFAMYRLNVEQVRYIGGFGRMSWVRAEEYVAADTDPLRQHVDEILEHCNNDHPDTLVLYCRAVGDAPDATAATMISVDRHGFDLSAECPDGRRSIRIPFQAQAFTPDDARAEMVQIAREARAKLGL